MNVPAIATAQAMRGAAIAGTSTLDTTPSHLTAPVPAAKRVAPTIPPMRACELLDGRPRYQVSRFQAMAPTRPAKTTVSVTFPESTMPEATVAATLRDRKAPTTFRTAERATATRGGGAPVAMDVAIALAVSWNPFVTSRDRAVTTTRTNRGVEASIRRGWPPHGPPNPTCRLVGQVFTA